MTFTKKQITISVFFLILFAIVIIFSTRSSSGNINDSNNKLKEFTVQRGTFRVMVSANGTIIPIDRVEIKSKASGLVEELPVEQGDFIRMGDLIARLDQKDERAAVSQARADYDIALAELKNAEREFARRKKLFGENLISEEERDQIELSLAVAKGKLVQATTSLERARERLSESVVQAPIDGIILQKYVEKGQIIASGISNVSGGTPIVDIADMSSVYVQAGVDEIDIGKISVGQNAAVSADAYPGLIFQGKIVRIAPEAKIEENVTLFDVIIEVENKEGKLKSGMNTSIDISIIEKENVLLLPTIAFQSPEQNKGKQREYTVMVKRNNNFIPLRIELGLENFKSAEVLSGVKEGDIIGIPITSRLKDSNDKREERIRSTRSFGTGS